MNENSRIFDFLYYQLAQFPKSDMLASKEGNGWKTYATADVVSIVNKLSAGLIKRGLGGNPAAIEEKHKIAVIANNRPEWIMLDLACQQAGIILCPVYPTTNPSEIVFIFNDASVKMVFTGGGDTFAKIESIAKQVPSLTHIFSFDNVSNQPFWEDVFTDVTEEDIAVMEQTKNNIKATDCATIIYTSGTTGTPKGVMLSHRNLVSNVLNSVNCFPFPKNITGRALSFLPLNHIFERMVTYIYVNSGISIYYAQSLETIGDDLKNVKPTLFTTVPRLLEKVYEKIMATGAALTGAKRKLFDWAVQLGNSYDVQKHGSLGYRLQLKLANKIIFNKWREALGGNVDFIITGGAACQLRLIRIFTAAGIPIYEGYGPTENSPVISVNSRKPNGTKFGTVGPVIDGQVVKIEPDGEICVKGPSVMMGYYKRPDLTAEAIIDGWLHTGDIGVLEDGHFLKITDRKKELFKTSGGKYVAPQVIENKLKESPFVEQIMVIGAEQKFVSALIVPSIPNLKEWMKTNDIEFTTAAAAVQDPNVKAMYKTIIEDFNQYFNPVEQVKKFELMPDEWSIETGEMTPKLSLKRKVIMEKYRQTIERLYSRAAN